MIRLGTHLLDLTVVGAERNGGRQLAEVVERTAVSFRLEHIADAAEVVGGV
jgi:hypothetical protein